MGNTSEKVIIQNIAKSAKIQSILTETCVKMARILAASVIEICQNMNTWQLPQGHGININISIHESNSNESMKKFKRRFKEEMKRSREEFYDELLKKRNGYEEEISEVVQHSLQRQRKEYK